MNELPQPAANAIMQPADIHQKALVDLSHIGENLAMKMEQEIHEMMTSIRQGIADELFVDHHHAVFKGRVLEYCNENTNRAKGIVSLALINFREAITASHAPRELDESMPQAASPSTKSVNSTSYIMMADVNDSTIVIEHPKNGNAYFVVQCPNCGRMFDSAIAMVSHINQGGENYRNLVENPQNIKPTELAVQRCGITVHGATRELVQAHNAEVLAGSGLSFLRFADIRGKRPAATTSRQAPPTTWRLEELAQECANKDVWPTMKKTLLLCFIHGFKGGDDTFGHFPEHLRALVSHGLPKIEVRAIVYPKYETRGELAECVGRFRDWLLEKVIDIEVDLKTPSPTVDPHVRTILIGHSMGGIVAADLAIAITSDPHVSSTPPSSPKAPILNSFMFPYIQGVLAFDTPYLGISPGVVAHGAEEHYNTASSAIAQLSGLKGVLWGSAAAEEAAGKGKKEAVAALPAPPPSTDASASSWQRWGKIAALAGTGAAIAAGGVAAYRNREQITQGWSWVGSHLEFVGCLMKGEELRKRVSEMATLNRELGVGFANLYTRLGKKAVSKNDGVTMVGSVIGNQRTFCNLPKKVDNKGFWHEAINDAAGDETGAHMTMFYPKDNPGFYSMAEDAKKLIVEWTTNEWYESSTGEDMKTFEMHQEL